MSEGARRAAELAARASYGRLLAIVSARSGDVAEAEDALADAFAAALRTWPEQGVPDRPEAWLIVAARRSAGHRRARRQTAESAAATLQLLAEERLAEPGGDPRLPLLFACAHPAIEPAAQAPLMLQLVLGLDAARIAGCFLVTPATMSQRLVRAKARIRDAGVPFAIPEGAELAARTRRVLDAIYAAYGAAWEDVMGADARRRGLAAEALWLARLTADALPDEPETHGLVSLILHCEARAEARRDPAGGFVPLTRQDPRRWSVAHVLEAETRLRRAAAMGRPGRYQTEAAIQSLHAEAAMTGRDLRVALVTLYDALVEQQPSLGAIVARAAAYLNAGRAGEAAAQLAAVSTRCRAYQPWWVAQAALLRATADAAGAVAALEVAIGLTADPAVRRFLQEQSSGFEVADAHDLRQIGKDRAAEAEMS